MFHGEITRFVRCEVCVMLVKSSVHMIVATIAIVCESVCQIIVQVCV